MLIEIGEEGQNLGYFSTLEIKIPLDKVLTNTFEFYFDN